MTRKLDGKQYQIVIEADTEPAPQDERVEPGAACPQCHERRADYLVTTDGIVIRCATCGTVYEL